MGQVHFAKAGTPALEILGAGTPPETGLKFGARAADFSEPFLITARDGTPGIAFKLYSGDLHGAAHHVAWVGDAGADMGDPEYFQDRAARVPHTSIKLILERSGERLGISGFVDSDVLYFVRTSSSVMIDSGQRGPYAELLRDLQAATKLLYMDQSLLDREGARARDGRFELNGHQAGGPYDATLSFDVRHTNYNAVCDLSGLVSPATLALAENNRGNLILKDVSLTGRGGEHLVDLLLRVEPTQGVHGRGVYDGACDGVAVWSGLPATGSGFRLYVDVAATRGDAATAAQLLLGKLTDPRPEVEPFTRARI